MYTLSIESMRVDFKGEDTTLLWKIYGSKQLIILGHRANTSRWVKRYIREGADGVEVDVVEANGRIVALHATPSRRKRLLRERIGDFLSSLKFTPPTPPEVLLRGVPDGIYIMFDLKNRVDPDIVVREIENIPVDSTNILVATRYHDSAPYLSSRGLNVLLSLDNRPINPSLLVEKSRAHGISINIDYLDAEIMSEIRHRDYVVATWLINSIEDFEKAVSLGVDIIVTDYPGFIKKLMKET